MLSPSQDGWPEPCASEAALGHGEGALEASEPSRVFQKAGMRCISGQSWGSSRDALPPRQAHRWEGRGCANSCPRGRGRAVCRGAEWTPAERRWSFLDPRFSVPSLCGPPRSKPLSRVGQALLSPLMAGGWDLLRMRLPFYPAPPPSPCSAFGPCSVCGPTGHCPRDGGVTSLAPPLWEDSPGSGRSPGRCSSCSSCHGLCMCETGLAHEGGGGARLVGPSVVPECTCHGLRPSTPAALTNSGSWLCPSRGPNGGWGPTGDRTPRTSCLGAGPLRTHVL